MVEEKEKLQSCTVEGQEVMHGEHVCLDDKCVICNKGKVEENYDNITGGMA